MPDTSDTRRASLADLKAMHDRGELRQPGANAYAIELDEAFWAEAAAPARRPTKTSVHLRLDPQTLLFFKGDGKGHLTRMARVLDAYVRSKQR
jgi:uncharacterized protein (DUF4415 family)